MSSKSKGRQYNAKFYKELATAQESAREVLPILFEIFRPQSVIDIGCGTGHWLAAAKELGAEDILGVDGGWVSKSQLAIPAEKFLVHDLSTPLKLGRRFDLALSFEVAEHLPETAARALVQSLCDASDAVAFSAAIPGQGGRRHLNEQWPSYWAQVFDGFGYDCYDQLRPRIWENPRVTWYYAQNSLIFVRRNAAAATTHARSAETQSQLGNATHPLSLVHPGLWSAEVARMKRPGKLLERLLKAILAAARKHQEQS